MLLKKNSILPFLILFLCLPACANKPVNNGLGNENPFASTGLLAHPNESAEEILLRAHVYDPEAVTLVTAGYIMGVGGFPKNVRLANMYLYAFRPMEGYYTSQLLGLMHLHVNLPSDVPDQHQCYIAKQSPAAPLFKQAGLFDLYAMCVDIGYKNDNPDIEYDKIYDALSTMLIELVSRPMTKQDTQSLRFAKLELSGFIEYQISNAGNKNASNQEKQLNLLKFIAQREGEFFPESKELKDIAANTLMQIEAAEVYAQTALEMIRKAHQGDPVAARQMAENYRTGAMGFPKNSALVAGWLEYAFHAGDKRAIDSLALYSYTYDRKSAWENANIGLRYGSPELKEAFTLIIKETEKGFTVEELQEIQKSLDRQLEQLKSSGFQVN